MTTRIWLASYPKSGNTWLRLLLANYFAKEDKPVDINDLPIESGIASSRHAFDHLLLVDSGLLMPDEIDCLRPRVYEELAQGAEPDEEEEPACPVRFVKVHDAYTLTPKGEPLLAGRRGADGAVVIVRDPRDIAPSLANHNWSTIDEAIGFMCDVASGFCVKAGKQSRQFRQKLPGWSGHVASWLDQSDIPIHLVRYEDMMADTATVLEGVLAFADIPPTTERIRRAAEYAHFGQLRQQELERGFREAPRPQPGGNFFRRGEAGAWRDELTPAQVARIEAGQARMMRRLGYSLAANAALLNAG